MIKASRVRKIINEISKEIAEKVSEGGTTVAFEVYNPTNRKEIIERVGDKRISNFNILIHVEDTVKYYLRQN